MHNQHVRTLYYGAFPSPTCQRLSQMQHSAMQSPLDRLQCSVMVVGIDGAGKSTILNHIKPPAQRRGGEQAPTIGCNFEELRYGNLALTVLDMAGGTKYRGMWGKYYAEADGFVFVVDSADALRMCVPGQASCTMKIVLCACM